MSKVTLALSLATASLWYRRRVLALVCLTLTLSVSLLLGIQYLRTEIRQSFTSTISGTDLIVGARSGQLNLLLYTVFHIGDATNNIRWSSFQKLEQDRRIDWARSEEHTSELQSRPHLVCRLLLEKKKKKKTRILIQ